MAGEPIGIFQAKTRLSSLVEDVLRGKRFVITRHGRPVAELRPIEDAGPRARRGCARSARFFMADDFDAPIEDFADSV
ncbi:MAG: type II toxin-antitoxin system prevent-host-death family antitoxin [Deltaproteobacteria bacterium]|nr:type II toxin-antitoxin system prevent-host-death family antitoxin [Deltaproteobacteria bacterium]